MQKQCLQCSVKFEITNADLEFYQKVSPKIDGKVYEIAPPKLCPDCRQQRRLAFRNERKLYKRKCNLCNKEIVSIYHQDSSSPVYCSDCWWSDKWNPLNYGRDFDFNKTFAENFEILLNVLPKMAHIQQGENQNSEYCNCASYNKNCYLLFSSGSNEECIYGTLIINSKDSVDNSSISASELCYECINIENCYNLKFSINCKNCSDSCFLKNCIGCQNCFGCVNLNNKKYYYFNKLLTKEEYLKKISELNLNYQNINELKKKWVEFLIKQPHKHIEGVNSEESTGNYLSNCKNAKHCFDSRNLWDSSFCGNLENAKNCYDSDYYGHKESNELLYECEGVGNGVFNVLFSKLIWGGSSNIFYCYECFKTQNCFGCVGLQHKNYCILNKQYTKEEYEALVPKIIEHMIRNNEWGEFFPITLSPFAYNETVAQEYFPLNKEEVIKRGWKWREQEDKIPSVTKIIPAEKLPDDIKDIPDDILAWAIKCEQTKRPFKIQKAELDFYRKMNLPIPHLHPDIRHENRMKKRNPRKLWNRKCSKCNIDIQTTYAPEREEKVLCEKCYLQEVN